MKTVQVCGHIEGAWCALGILARDVPFCEAGAYIYINIRRAGRGLGTHGGPMRPHGGAQGPPRLFFI